VIDAGAMANPMFRMKGAQIGEGAFEPAFPLKHMQKDLRLAVSLGDTLGQPLFLAAAANESFKKARALGLSDLDFCAVFQAING
jgi:2-hydroxy-3-oxopropionate reductase